MTTTLGERHRELVTESFTRILPLSAEATATFYDRLWQIAPETKALFHKTDMVQQGLKLMQTLGVIVRGLHDLNSIASLLNDLGQRHRGYGVTRDQFELVRVALLAMMEHCLGDDFTPEVHDAWSSAYDVISEMALRAYE